MKHCGSRYIKRNDKQANWKTSGLVWEILCLPSADTIEGRDISTAWPIIWSNGSPSVRNKSPGLFCISSSDDWPTFVPRRWSQLKAPSVKWLRLPDAEPRWEIHTLSLTHQFTVMCVFSLCLFSRYFLLFSLPPPPPHPPSKSPCQAFKSNFILPVLSRSVYTISYCLVSSVISKFSIYIVYIGNIQCVVNLICEPRKNGLKTKCEIAGAMVYCVLRAI